MLDSIYDSKANIEAGDRCALLNEAKGYEKNATGPQGGILTLWKTGVSSYLEFGLVARLF